jgi:hypothetical protein
MATNVKKQNTKLRVLLSSDDPTKKIRIVQQLPKNHRELRGFRLSWVPEFNLTPTSTAGMFIALGNYWSHVFTEYPTDRGITFSHIGQQDCYKMGWRKKSGPHVLWTIVLKVSNGKPEFHFDLNYGWLHARRLLKDEQKTRDLWNHNHYALTDHAYTLFSEQLQKLLIPTLQPADSLTKNEAIVDAQINMVLDKAKIRKILLEGVWTSEDRKKLNTKINELLALLEPLDKELRSFKPHEEVTRLPKVRSSK